MLARALRRAVGALGWLALAGVFVTALRSASLAFDSWYYHLPFAARLVGLLPSSSYVFHPANEARYAGLPLLAELLQGLLWRITGHAEAANLVAFSSVPLVAWFLSSRFRVPPSLTCLGLLAIPLVQTHASSCYVDLPGNAAACVLVLLVVALHATDAPPAAGDVALAVVAGGVAANIKPLLQPAVGLCLLAIVVRAARDPRSRRLVPLVLLAAPAVLFTPLKNVVVHHNPFYPIEAHLFGLTLPGPEAPYASSPAWLATWPRPARFLVSILEIGVRPLTDARRWTVDQWMPEETGGNRLGGFFGAYVALLLTALVVRVARDRSRLVRTAAVVFTAFTVLIACMPQSHELRYYLSWMMALVALNLVLAAQAPNVPGAAGPVGLGVVAALAFGTVVASTRGAYVYPGGMSVRELVDAKVDATVLARLKDGEEVCVRREPFNLLWADLFHPPRRYRVREAENEADCGGVPELPGP